mmetsp:Transcript_52007/g.113040  ORF Transcript_52007/g.113040 Transcript_52007/m.113040 type:complete len:296 (+) Transcript_52007:323-1210(+)
MVSLPLLARIEQQVTQPRQLLLEDLFSVAAHHLRHLLRQHVHRSLRVPRVRQRLQQRFFLLCGRSQHLPCNRLMRRFVLGKFVQRRVLLLIFRQLLSVVLGLHRPLTLCCIGHKLQPSRLVLACVRRAMVDPRPLTLCCGLGVASPQLSRKGLLLGRQLSASLCHLVQLVRRMSPKQVELRRCRHSPRLVLELCQVSLEGVEPLEHDADLASEDIVVVAEELQLVTTRLICVELGMFHVRHSLCKCVQSCNSGLGHLPVGSRHRRIQQLHQQSMLHGFGFRQIGSGFSWCMRFPF